MHSSSPLAKLENSPAAAATTKHSILSHIVMPPLKPLWERTHSVPSAGQGTLQSPGMVPFPVSYLHI